MHPELAKIMQKGMLVFPFSLLAVVDATYSVVATDAKTRQVGGAGASCVPRFDMFDALYLSAPNRSVLHTQGSVLDHNGTVARTALEMMETDEPIDAVLAKMRELDTSLMYGSSYPLVDQRQYGMADFKGNNSHGGYSGNFLQTVYDDFLGIKNTEQVDRGVGRNDEGAGSTIRGRYSFHAQGNVVAKGTVSSLVDGFLGGDDEGNCHCDMAGRLMAAMERVVEGGLGDMRCINDHGGVSASGAFLHIDNADGTQLIHINKVGDGSFEPVEEVRREFIAWRESNPCPMDTTDEKNPASETAAVIECHAQPLVLETSGCDGMKNGSKQLLNMLVFFVAMLFVM